MPKGMMLSTIRLRNKLVKERMKDSLFIRMKTLDLKVGGVYRRIVIS